MKTMLALLLTLFAFAAQAGEMNHPWIVKDIARKSGLSACAVERVLGDQSFLAAARYSASPASRRDIARRVRQHHDVLVATAQAQGLAEAEGCSVDEVRLRDAKSNAGRSM